MVRKKKAKKTMKKAVKKKVEIPVSENIVKTVNIDGIEVEDAMVK